MRDASADAPTPEASGFPSGATTCSKYYTKALVLMDNCLPELRVFEVWVTKGR